MSLKTVQTTNQESVFAYLDEVLTYYKSAEDASLGEWPTLQIEWEDFQKTAAFYGFVIVWFAKRNIDVIFHNGKKRYLSTFILAAEFPPTLGYGRLVEELVRQCGWLSLYHFAQSNVAEYVKSIDINTYTVAQRQSLDEHSEGYSALLNLINILASIRYSLDCYENFESICASVSEQNNWDLDLVLRIAHAYKDIIIPVEKSTEIKQAPIFNYQLVQEDLDWKLVIRHTLRKKVSIPLPSSISLPRFGTGTLSIVCQGENVVLDKVSQLVKLEAKEGFLEIESSFQSDFIPVSIRNRGLKKIQFILTVTDTNASIQQLLMGQIKRNSNFLIFGKSGTEIVSNTLLFKQGEMLRIVPLVDTVATELQKSKDFFQEEQTGNLPVFQTIKTQLPSILVGKTELQFRAIPFTIKLRDQTAWETAFNRSKKVITYFFSPMMEMQLEGEFPENVHPLIKLENRINNTDGNESRLTILTSYSQGIIRPLQPLPSAGQYTLTVAFGEDRPSFITFNLLPVRSIKLIEDKHIQLKMYAPVKDFQLLDSRLCNCKYNGYLVDIRFLAYGKHEIEARYFSQFSDRYTRKSTLKFTFEAIEEVVGHFSRVLDSGTETKLSLEHDLIANSYLEFRKTSLRNSAIPYKISAYMEYSQRGLRILPKSMVMYADRANHYSLASLVTYVRTNQYSRLLIIVAYEETEIYRVEFLSNRRPILDLEKEWNQGAYSSLLALPISTLQSEIHQSLQSLPTNCLVYGMIENAKGKEEIATFGTFIKPTMLAETDLVPTFLARCNEFLYPNESITRLLKQILQSPEHSYELLRWLTEADAWYYPYDIKIFAKLLDTFPVLVAWAELALNPSNRKERFALCTTKAQKQYKAGMLYLPELSRIIDHPRFLPELITINSLEILEELGLLPTEEPIITLFAFCCNPFITNGKPVLSWVALFWLRRYCVRKDMLADFLACFPIAQAMKMPMVTSLKETFIENLPTYIADQKSEQDFEKILRKEQKQYLNAPFARITGLSDFLNAVEKPFFTNSLAHIIQHKTLTYAEPNLTGFATSTKWKSIIFLSLTAVCTQLDVQPYLKYLHELWTFDHKTYLYLLHWLNNHEETARIYNAYYEYWMTRFWEEENV